MIEVPIDTLFNVIEEIVPPETSVAIADEKRFIYYQPSKKVNLKIQPGDYIHEETVTYKALVDRQKYAAHKDERLFGTPYYGISIPIIQNGFPKGCITSILPEKNFQLSTDFLTIETTDRWVTTALKDILFIETYRRKTYVQSTEHFGTHKRNLTQLEFILPEEFFRCHRSYIVNLNQIKEIHPASHSTFTLILNQDYKVPVSQTYASELRQRLHF